MESKRVKSLKFSEKAYPEVVDAVNDLAKIEGRKPHDTAKRILLINCRARINELMEENRNV